MSTAVFLTPTCFYWPIDLWVNTTMANATVALIEGVAPLRCRLITLAGYIQLVHGGSKPPFLLDGHHLLGIYPSPNWGMQEMSDKSWLFRDHVCGLLFYRAGCVWICFARSFLFVYSCMYFSPWTIPCSNRHCWSNRYMAHHGTHWNARNAITTVTLHGVQHAVIHLFGQLHWLFFVVFDVFFSSNDCTDETCEPPAVSTKAQDLNPHRAPPWGVPSPAAWRLSGGFHVSPRWWGSPGQTA